jgi:RNA polymerase sigma factor (sigma-70 family)
MLSAMEERTGRFEVDALLREAGWLRSLSRALSDLPDRALELEQETWLAAVRAQPSTDRGLRPWLATVMRNAARAFARADAQRALRDREAAREEALPSSHELAARADVQRALVEHVLALEEPYRSTVLLCFYEGLAPGEVARRQGVPAGSVRSRLSRGVELLRRRLDDRCGGERSRWLSALTPLGAARPEFAALSAFPVSLAAGVAMKKFAVVVLVLCLATAGWYAMERDALPRAETVAPVAAPDGALARPAAGGGAAAQEPPEPTAPAEPREALAAPPPPAPAPPRPRVRLVDELTAEAVPEFELALVGEDPATARVVSDASGEFELDVRPGDRVRLDLVENLGGNDLIQTTRDRVDRVRVELDAPAPATTAPLELRIPVGPTYRLALTPPPGHSLAELEASLRSADPRQAFDVARARVREGALPWLRFRPAANFVAAGPPWKLEVQTDDGLWCATASVDERSGIAQRTVALTFESRARLTGKLLGPDGAAIAREYVRLEREGASFDDPKNRPQMQATRADGGFDYRALSPGKWTLSAAIAGYEEWRSELTLGELESRAVEVRLAAAAPGAFARIEGVIESTTGAYDDAVYVSLYPAAGGAGQGAKVAWSEVDGRRQGRFVAEGLKPGKYRVSARVPGLLSVEPRVAEVEAGGEIARFVVRDDVQSVAWHARAFAGESALPEFRVTLEADGLVVSASAAQGLAVVEHIPSGTLCEYTVRADGFAPRYGELAIDGTTSAESAARFELQPGWGTAVTVVDRDGGPIARARIYFDDQFAAETDDRGRARVVLDHEPQTVRVEHLDWRLAPGTSIAPETGRFRTWEPFLRVVLEPRS